MKSNFYINQTFFENDKKTDYNNFCKAMQKHHESCMKILETCHDLATIHKQFSKESNNSPFYIGLENSIKNYKESIKNEINQNLEKIFKKDNIVSTTTWEIYLTKSPWKIKNNAKGKRLLSYVVVLSFTNNTMPDKFNANNIEPSVDYAVFSYPLKVDNFHDK